ncbi:Rieske (2Fe-2S) protein [Streptomyces sp. GXMU-J15]|uniref:Cytochrome bc1 complex Rieske iron-sulfur subunit n=1 Tax=Streptomyces fuscus TaxID=3048495 RepID=A0ABT7IZL5_9ACTN|nr:MULTISPECIES: Rieske (2Fe-2S) protein [Streptomyces]MDL2078039.1 Rieske (2Fe-2S) protein [Streptomyces fuscus]SBT95417.1 Ferredoxin subunit of nitrite reductase or a ring-hydroxylating dioxygenase [Streptomyces sp. DI166]
MTSEPLHPVTPPSRRTVVAAVGAVGFSLALNACGSEDEKSQESSGAAGAAGAAEPTGTVVAKTSDIPEGSGKILKEHKVVVTQPAAGTFKAFSFECTHQGCPVTGIADGAITCPCHNSRFSIEDGSVQKGPATQPLSAREVTVSGDSITLT